jgi:hypothetical protein
MAILAAPVGMGVNRRATVPCTRTARRAQSVHTRNMEFYAIIFGLKEQKFDNAD